MKTIIAYFVRSGTVKGLQIFQILRFLSFFITGILLSKTFLKTAEIGIYENLMFLSGAFSFFWVSGILNAVVAKYDDSDIKKSDGLIYNSSLLIFLINILLIILLLILEQWASHLIPENPETYYPLLIVYILLNNTSFINEYYFLLKKKTIPLILYGLGSFLLHLAFVFIPLYFGGTLSCIFYGLIALALIKNLILLYNLRIGIKSSFNFTVIKELGEVALPLILSLLIAGSAEYVDGFLISTHFRNDAFAIFRYGAREFPLSLLMANSLSMAIIPRLRKGEYIDSNGLENLKAETNSLMHLVFPTSILLMLASPYLYPIVFRPEFISSSSIFNIYLLLVISRVLFPQSIIMSQVRTSVIFKTAIAEIFINVLASYALMLQFGMIGVAYGTFIAFFCEKIILAIYCHFELKIPLSRYLNVKVWLIYTIMLLIAFSYTIQ